MLTLFRPGFFCLLVPGGGAQRPPSITTNRSWYGELHVTEQCTRHFQRLGIFRLTQLRNMTSFVDSMGRIQIASAFPSKRKIHHVSDKIKKLVDTLMTFNTSSDVMMTSFMVKEGSGTIRHLGSAIFNFSNVSNFT